MPRFETPSLQGIPEPRPGRWLSQRAFRFGVPFSSSILCGVLLPGVNMKLFVGGAGFAKADCNTGPSWKLLVGMRVNRSRNDLEKNRVNSMYESESEATKHHSGLERLLQKRCKTPSPVPSGTQFGDQQTKFFCLPFANFHVFTCSTWFSWGFSMISYLFLLNWFFLWVFCFWRSPYPSCSGADSRDSIVASGSTGASTLAPTL